METFRKRRYNPYSIGKPIIINGSEKESNCAKLKVIPEQLGPPMLKYSRKVKKKFLEWQTVKELKVVNKIIKVIIPIVILRHHFISLSNQSTISVNKINNIKNKNIGYIILRVNLYTKIISKLKRFEHSEMSSWGY